MTPEERAGYCVVAPYGKQKGVIVDHIRAAVAEAREACARLALDECCAKDVCEHECGYKNLAAAFRARAAP